MDLILIKLPNSVEMLFRINTIRYNTIQSNDFYMLSADLRHSGDNCCNEIEKLVVESYHCVFENIGTQDNCFIKLDDEDEAEELKVTIDLLSTMYHDLFYDRDIGDYLYFKQFPVPYNYFDMRHCYYDIFLAKFINDSMLFFTGDNIKLVLDQIGMSVERKCLDFTSELIFDILHPKILVCFSVSDVFDKLMNTINGKSGKKLNVLRFKPYNIRHFCKIKV